jgi:hypothetical protein
MASKRRFIPRPQQWLDDSVFAALEKDLGLNTPSERLRKRLNLSVSLYLWDCQRIRPNRAAAQKRFKAVKDAARNLYVQLNENPVEVAARAAIKIASDKLLAGKEKVGREFSMALKQEVQKLPDSKLRTYYLNLFGEKEATDDFEIDDVPDEREVVSQLRGLVLRKAGIDLDAISKELDRLIRFIGSLKQDRGGRPAADAWNHLMLSLAEAYEEATGEKATVTENEHRAAAGERYSGAFVRAATIIDRETAAVAFPPVRPRPNRQLGPALRRLLKARSATKPIGTA